jgi:glucose/arabinose dehydrogenase
MRNQQIAAAGVALAVLALSGTGALCRLKYDCGIGPGRSLDDAGLLRKLREENTGAPAARLPPEFRERIVARGFNLPTDFAFLPNGDVLVSQKNGVVWRVTPGRPGRAVVLDLRPRIDTAGYRGLITVAVSPRFAVNRTIYVLYVRKRPGAGARATTIARFSAFELSADGRRPPRERVLIGTATVPTCSGVPATADCLASDRDHDGAQLAFARDGTIYLATGDGGGYDNRVETGALRAQDPDALAGKILHIDPNGNGVPGNPWWNGDPRANRSKVWALGLRNPFRLTLDPRSSIPIVGDVGRHAYEEIDVTPRGSNLGWPCFEARTRIPLYARTSTCVALYRRPHGVLTFPLVALRHPFAKSIVGGTFAPSTFPHPYRAAYFFADWVRGWIRFVDVAAERKAGSSRIFATRAPGPVALHVGPDDRLYYLTLNSGDLRRLDVVP